MRRFLPALTLVSAPALALALTACGSSSTAATPSAASGSLAAPPAVGGPAPADLEAYRQCLAQHGVTLPDAGPGSRPGGPGDRDDSDRPMNADDSMPMASGSMDPNHPPTVGGGDRGDHPAPPGVDAQAWAAAEQACGDLGEMMGRPDDGRGPGGDHDGDHGRDGDGPDEDAVSLPPTPSG